MQDRETIVKIKDEFVLCRHDMLAWVNDCLQVTFVISSAVIWWPYLLEASITKGQLPRHIFHTQISVINFWVMSHNPTKFLQAGFDQNYDPLPPPCKYPKKSAGRAGQNWGIVHGGCLLPVHGHALPWQYTDQKGGGISIIIVPDHHHQTCSLLFPGSIQIKKVAILISHSQSTSLGSVFRRRTCFCYRWSSTRSRSMSTSTTSKFCKLPSRRCLLTR